LTLVTRKNETVNVFLNLFFLPFQNKQGGPPPHPYVPRSASGRLLAKPPTSRGHVKHSKGKGKKGKKGKKDQYDLIVNIDLVISQISYRNDTTL
jgi:hypothetical protein